MTTALAGSVNAYHWHNFLPQLTHRSSLKQSHSRSGKCCQHAFWGFLEVWNVRRKRRTQPFMIAPSCVLSRISISIKLKPATCVLCQLLYQNSILQHRSTRHHGLDTEPSTPEHPDQPSRLCPLMAPVSPESEDDRTSQSSPALSCPLQRSFRHPYHRRCLVDHFWRSFNYCAVSFQALSRERKIAMTMTICRPSVQIRMQQRRIVEAASSQVPSTRQRYKSLTTHPSLSSRLPSGHLQLNVHVIERVAMC